MKRLFIYLMLLLLCIVGCGTPDTESLFDQDDQKTIDSYDPYLCPDEYTYISSYYIGQHFSSYANCGYFNRFEEDVNIAGSSDFNGSHPNPPVGNGKSYREVLCCKNTCLVDDVNPKDKICK